MRGDVMLAASLTLMLAAGFLAGWAIYELCRQAQWPGRVHTPRQAGATPAPATNKVIAGLEDAVAYARGDKSRARIAE